MYAAAVSVLPQGAEGGGVGQVCCAVCEGGEGSQCRCMCGVSGLCLQHPKRRIDTYLQPSKDCCVLLCSSRCDITASQNKTSSKIHGASNAHLPAPATAGCCCTAPLPPPAHCCHLHQPPPSAADRPCCAANLLKSKTSDIQHAPASTRDCGVLLYRAPPASCALLPLASSPAI